MIDIVLKSLVSVNPGGDDFADIVDNRWIDISGYYFIIDAFLGICKAKRFIR